jgi:hypothetical protein
MLNRRCAPRWIGRRIAANLSDGVVLVILVAVVIAARLQGQMFGARLAWGKVLGSTPPDLVRGSSRLLLS